jgi:hypothetical protein
LHGMALQEITQHYKLKSRKYNNEKSQYLAMIGRISERLQDIEENGYTEWDDAHIEKEILDTCAAAAAAAPEASGSVNRQDSVASSEEASTTSSNKKNNNRKNKKKWPPTTNESDKNSDTAAKPIEVTVAKNRPTKPDDPVVTALMGMGFTKEQIMDGVKACGGIDRATADDVIAWIFGGNEEQQPSSVEEAQQQETVLEALAATTTDTDDY